LALITGLGMSPALSPRIKAGQPGAVHQVARSLHFLVLAWFVFFIVIHVTLVFSTGLLRNLNHTCAGRNDSAWIGFGLFAVTTALMVIARLGGHHPGHPAPPPDDPADRVRADRAGTAAVRARRRHPG
jgi:methionine sulfoxide reductase catalytic subunit